MQMIKAAGQLALARQSTSEIARALSMAEARPIRSNCLGVDFYRPSHASLPLDRMRFVVARFEWSGFSWRRVYKYGGPRPLNEIQQDLDRHAERLGIPIIDQA